MRSEEQKAASIRNGAKSQGPVTENGKARSSQNATRHGLTGRIVVLSNEDPEAYRQLLEACQEEWRPATRTELDLVNDIAACRWRLNRIVSLETAAIDLEMDRGRDRFAEEFVESDEATRCVVAWQTLSEHGRTLNTLGRHESRLRRALDRSVRHLQQLKNLQNKPGNSPA